MEPSVRYIVDDVPAAAEFYTRLGFEDVGPKSEGFALMRGHGLRLLLNTPGAGGAVRPSDDGRTPAPGGWNRIQVEVGDVTAEVARLEHAGGRVRTSVVEGRGGSQAVVEDPSGNPVELFSPAG